MRKAKCDRCGAVLVATQLRLADEPDSGWCKHCRTYTPIRRTDDNDQTATAPSGEADVEVLHRLREAALFLEEIGSGGHEDDEELDPDLPVPPP